MKLKMLAKPPTANDAAAASHDDETRYHREIVDKLQKEYKRLEQRLEAMYVDKLDGKIGERFYEQKSAEWREDQKDILRRLEQHQDASQSYMDEGIALMELANRAVDLFEKQPASEKRRLLEFVLSNSFWANGELTPEFRQPFDMLADMATVGAQKMAAGGLTSSHHQEELPEGNSLRNQSHFAEARKPFWINSLTFSRHFRSPKTESNQSESAASRLTHRVASYVERSRCAAVAADSTQSLGRLVQPTSSLCSL